MSEYVPEAGDIVIVNFDPQSGREVMKRRPGLVLSPKSFNDQLGTMIVVPISSTDYNDKIAPNVTDYGVKEVKGRVITWQVKSQDFVTREAVFVEKAPDSLLRQVRSVVKVFMGL